MKLFKEKVEGDKTKFTATLIHKKGEGVESYGVITEDEGDAREKIIEWAKSQNIKEEDFL